MSTFLMPMPFRSPGPKSFAAAIAVVSLGVLALVVFRLPQKKRDPSIRILALGSTGQWAAGGEADGTIRIWNLAEAAPSGRTLAKAGKVNDLQFSAADESLAVADENLTLVALPAGDARRVLRDDRANYGTARFSADGRMLLTITGRGAVLTADLMTGAVRPVYCCSTIAGEVDFTPDGSGVIWAGHWPGIWDLRSNTLAGRLTESRQFLTFGPIAWDTGGRVLLGSQDGRVSQWDLASRMRIRTSPPLPGYVHSMAVLGDTGWIAYAAERGPVYLWHPETGERRVVAGARPTSNLVFDAAGNRTAFGTDSGAIAFWDLVGGRMLLTLP